MIIPAPLHNRRYIIKVSLSSYDPIGMNFQDNANMVMFGTVEHPVKQHDISRLRFSITKAKKSVIRRGPLFPCRASSQAAANALLWTNRNIHSRQAAAMINKCSTPASVRLT